jgi:hypothetical protein
MGYGKIFDYRGNTEVRETPKTVHGQSSVVDGQRTRRDRELSLSSMVHSRSFMVRGGVVVNAFLTCMTFDAIIKTYVV